MGISATQMTSHWGTQKAVERDGLLSRGLLYVVDGGLVGIVGVAPYFFGGRHDLGRLVLVSLVAITSAAWFLRQVTLPRANWPRTWIYAVSVLACSLLILQVIPLPPAWIERLSPETAKLLPVWSASSEAAVHQGSWRTLSLIPHETVKSLAMLVSYSLLFTVVVGRIRTPAEVHRTIGLVGFAALAMAVFGVLQHATSDGSFFWFYDHPHRSADASLSGAFINRNHFAHFLVLGIGPLVASLIYVLRLTNRSRISFQAGLTATKLAAWAIAAALALVVLVCIASRSRGGGIALLAAVTVLLTVYFRHGVLDSRFSYGLAGFAALLLLTLSWSGYDRALDRLDDLAEGSIEKIDQGGTRRKIWAANVDAIQSFPLTGTGAGSHREICPVYLTESSTREYTHAESGYLQVVTENGVAGAALLVTAIAIVGSWCLRALRANQTVDNIVWCSAAIAGLVASVVHSLVDFVWYIPACMSVTVLLAACVLRLSQFVDSTAVGSTAREFPRLRWLEMAVAVILVGAWCVHSYVGPGIAAVHWDRYLRASVEGSEFSDEAMTRFVTDGTTTSHDHARDIARTTRHHLEAAIRWDPHFARAHRRLADRYVAEFELRLNDGENVLDVGQIRDAARASSFRSVPELHNWLVRAFGTDVQLLQAARYHSRRAVELCPLQGDSYLRLAELAFLDLATTAVVDGYIDQALLVRPSDRNVLTRAGRQALVMGRPDRAVQYWSRCFHVPGRHQQEIIYRLVAAGMPAREFLASFHPDWGTIRRIWNQYRKLGNVDELQEVLTYAESETRREISAPTKWALSHIWYWQAGLYSDVNRNEESLECLQRAYACDPRQYAARYALARALQNSGRPIEAEAHVRWCLARRPTDHSLRAALEAISKAKVDRRAATDPADYLWKPSVTLATPARTVESTRN